MSRIAKVVKTVKTTTTGGRENGVSRSSDGLLDIRLSVPGSVRIGTNPEQLLAAGWSASFASAIASVTFEQNIPLPAGVSIDAEIDLNLGDDGYSLSARLNVRLPDLKDNVARTLIDEACNICPYSKATRGNVEITITCSDPDCLYR
ncbi:Ohr family peroxiredoxin [Phyllobacterium sp. LjRoot231]|uniref:Ohr family peroxiredoxin n=1 Tax=Phyllobacterium sp. LjRoot231 TaxID=3342289 RepID=UPI003ECF491B